MDALVKLVVERLEKRMTSTATFMVTECNSYDEHVLLQNQLISFTGVDYGHIRELMSNTLVPWVVCLHRALAYDCEVTIRLAVPVTSLLKPSVILDWPIRFLDKFGRPICASHQAWITASFIRTCDSQSIIVIYRGQRFTMAARDEIERLGITIIEGNETYASR